MPAIRLADLAPGRDNNFNLIRLLAATAVVLFHSYALTGHWTDEPLWKLAPEINFGALGVKAFFFVSGFLVTKSYCERGRLVPFAAARVLRIYPALFCATLVTIALAAWSSAHPLAAFLADRETPDFAWQAATAFDVRDRLPGAYASNPYPDSVNGSLWTLPVEMRLYVALGIAGLAGLLTRRRAWLLLVVALVALFFVEPAWFPLAKYGPATQDLALVFALGSLAYVWRDRLELSATAALVAVVVIAWNPAGLGRGWLFEPLLAYVLLVTAYHPRLAWPAFNRIGDYSYGLYIYAFPIQQTVARLVPGVEPVAMFALAFPPTLALAAISWHLVEMPALRLKSRFR